jgi:long-chain fatty acid transport protein
MCRIQGFEHRRSEAEQRLGGAVYVPYGGSADWGRNTYYDGSSVTPGGYDGPQRWATISGKIQSLHATLATSYTLRDLRLSVGANVSFIANSVVTVRARNTDGSDDTRVTEGDRFGEGRSLLDVKANTFGAALGVYWEPLADRSVTVGASYTSQPGFGENRLKGKLAFQGGTSVSDQLPPTGDVDLLQSFPAVWRLGGTWKVDAEKKWELRADGVFAQWSVFDKQCIVKPDQDCKLNPDGSQSATGVVVNIPRNWKNAFGVRVGGAHYLNKDVELFGSLGYATPAAPSSTVDASTLDSTRYTAGFGSRFQVTENLKLAASAAVVYFTPLSVKDSIYGTQKGESKSPSANGDYTSIVPIVDVNGIYTF